MKVRGMQRIKDGYLILEPDFDIASETYSFAEWWRHKTELQLSPAWRAVLVEIAAVDRRYLRRFRLRPPNFDKYRGIRYPHYTPADFREFAALADYDTGRPL